ncbi:MAG: rod shape-determining protein MreC [Pseudomonadota bacterium]
MAPSNRRPGFSRRAQYSLFLGYVIAGVGAIGGVGLLALSTFDPVAFRALRGGVAEVTTPVSSALAAGVRTLAGVPAWASDYIAVADQNRALKREIDNQRAMIMRARTLSYDNRRLRALLKVRDGVSEPVVAARLVNSSASSTRRYATLNAGAWQGVRPGQPVRGPDGLIGRTIAVTPNTTRVMLLADPESIVPVRRTRDGLSAIAVGRGDGWIELKSAAASAVDFARGDVFVTSGTGGLFPPGIPVARVIEKASDTALGRTFAQPDTIDYALVMKVFVEQPIVPETAP